MFVCIYQSKHIVKSDSCTAFAWVWLILRALGSFSSCWMKLSQLSSLMHVEFSCILRCAHAKARVGSYFSFYCLFCVIFLVLIGIALIYQSLVFSFPVLLAVFLYSIFINFIFIIQFFWNLRQAVPIPKQSPTLKLLRALGNLGGHSDILKKSCRRSSTS